MVADFMHAEDVTTVRDASNSEQDVSRSDYSIIRLHLGTLMGLSPRAETIKQTPDILGSHKMALTALSSHRGVDPNGSVDSSSHSQWGHLPGRDALINSLLMAAAFSSEPQTHHHTGHTIYPSPCPPKCFHDGEIFPCTSRQAPRSLHLRNCASAQGDSQNGHQIPKSLGYVDPILASSLPRPLLVTPVQHSISPLVTQPRSHTVEVKCMGRTRIPTFHGAVFLHIYHNNRDNKEHLAIVADPAQFSNDNQLSALPIRSHSLDARWRENESESERITRGAYIGRLTPESQLASQPIDRSISSPDIPAPLVRIHSECFTGETLGSMRCDCGEQLDEAMRLISQPVHVNSSPPAIIPGRGVVVYMRQEGRGIGLLSKVLAYNLQDLGHDTVSANLKLGYKADEREYEVAVAILRDLGLGSEQGEGIRLLTNNPDKVSALEKEGLKVVERVPMVPRHWKCQSGSGSPPSDEEGNRRLPGAMMVGGDAVSGEDLNRYLRTKVLRMGHLLPLPSPTLDI